MGSEMCIRDRSDTTVVADRGGLYVLLEHPFELTLRDAHLGGQPGYWNWVLYVAFHQIHSPKNAGVCNSETESGRRSLVIFRIPDFAHDELIGNLRRHVVTEMDTNQMEHQIHCGRSTRAGKSITVDFEQIPGRLNSRIGLDETIKKLPVDGRPISIQQAGFREEDGARPQCAKMGTLSLIHI